MKLLNLLRVPCLIEFMSEMYSLMEDVFYRYTNGSKQGCMTYD